MTSYLSEGKGTGIRTANFFNEIVIVKNSFCFML